MPKTLRSLHHDLLEYNKIDSMRFMRSENKITKLKRRLIPNQSNTKLRPGELKNRYDEEPGNKPNQDIL